jgi:hypothetical protein
MYVLLSSFPLSLAEMFAHDGSCTRRFAAEVGQRTGTALVVSPEDVQEVTVNKKENAPSPRISLWKIKGLLRWYRGIYIVVFVYFLSSFPWNNNPP